MNKVRDAVSEYLKNDIPTFRSGDTINVGVKVVEGNKSRVQNFEGVVIAISSGGGMDKTFTIRKISNGVGVERIFPIHSPNLDYIKVVKHGKVRRAKIYYLRNLKGKAARIKERTPKIRVEKPMKNLEAASLRRRPRLICCSQSRIVPPNDTNVQILMLGPIRHDLGVDNPYFSRSPIEKIANVILAGKGD